MADAPLILLLRSPDAEGDDRYIRALERRGLRAVCRPVLRFAVAGDEDFEGGDLQAQLSDPDRYSGLVVTSPRAARVLADALRRSSGSRPAWKAKPAFCVGPRTARLLSEAGLSPRGAENGNASSLASAIERAWKEGDAAAPLLFLCGNRRRDEVPRRLGTAAIPFEECVVYETRLRGGPWLGDAPDWAAFFSPSGIEAARRSRESGWAAVRKAAIGPTTARALREAGWDPDAVAREPSPDALAEAIREAAERI